MTDGGNYRTRRSALNYASGVLGTALALVVSFVTTPLIVRWLGDQRYGAVRATGDWFGYLALMEFGLGGALAPLLALALGRRDADKVRRTMTEGIRAYTLVAAATAGAGLVITIVIRRLVSVTPDLAPELRIGCLIAVVGLLLYPLSPFRTLADANQRGWLVNLGSMTQSLVTTTLAALLAWKGFGIPGQFAALFIGQLVLATMLTRDGLVRFPGLLRAAAREPRDPETRQQIRQLNVPTVLFDVAGRVGLLTDNIVVALVLGPTLVTPLFLTQRLIVLSQVQLQAVGNASWAALSELYALGRRDVFNARLVELTRLVTALGVAVVVPVAAFSHAFVDLWVGETRYGGGLVVTIAAINALLLALVSLWGWCFSGTGQVRTLVPMMLGSALLNLTLSIVGTMTIGLAGPLLGTMVAISSTTLWYLPAMLHKHFDTDVGALARAVIMPLAWAAIPGVVIVWFGRRFPPGSWVGLGADVIVGIALLLGVWWFGELSAEQRRHYADRFSMALPRRRG